MRWSSLSVPTGFLVSRRTFCASNSLWFHLQGFHLLRPTFPSRLVIIINPYPHWLLRFRSSLLPESLLLSFPHPTKIFQFGWSRLAFAIHALLACGFAHSDSSGSLLTYSSPKRFAVRRVLLRLLVPRHPLCALISLTFTILIRLLLSTFQRSFD